MLLTCGKAWTERYIMLVACWEVWEKRYFRNILLIDRYVFFGLGVAGKQLRIYGTRTCVSQVVGVLGSQIFKPVCVAGPLDHRQFKENVSSLYFCRGVACLRFLGVLDLNLCRPSVGNVLVPSLDAKVRGRIPRPPHHTGKYRRKRVDGSWVKLDRKKARL